MARKRQIESTRERTRPGKRYDDLTERERVAQRGERFYAHDPLEWEDTDIVGRHVPGHPGTEGMHEPFPGRER